MPRRVVLVFVAAIAVVGAVVAWRAFLDATRPDCTVTIDDEHADFDREQVRNAEIITGAAARLGLPNHAVTVAVAAALQESQLRNLPHGDRDSLGVFQQRPSQGWGTREQILDPVYASEAFLRALAEVPNWDTMPVNDAAQRVQRSATPSAYAKWESSARLLARALTGEAPGTLVCRSGS